jgi:hypothetical protein
VQFLSRQLTLGRSDSIVALFLDLATIYESEENEDEDTVETEADHPGRLAASSVHDHHIKVLMEKTLPVSLEWMASPIEATARLAVMKCIALMSTRFPVIAKKNRSVLPGTIAACLDLMSNHLQHGDDTAAWENDCKSWELRESEGYDSEIFNRCLDALEMITCALGERKSYPMVWTFVQDHLDDAEWKHRHAAIMMLNQVGQLCSRDDAPDVFRVLMSKWKDPHPRVRYAALDCFGQWMRDQEALVQMDMVDECVPQLLDLLQDPVVRVVRACGLSA